MRKFLLGTTAVAGAALIGMGAAQAQQAPTVRIGGYFEFTAGWILDSLDSSGTVNAAGAYLPGNPTTGSVIGPVTAGPFTNPARGVRRDRVDFRSDAEIHVFVTGKAANGISYGATIELEIDALQATGTFQGAANSGTQLGTDEVWGFVSSPALGTLRFGDEDSAASLLAVPIANATFTWGPSTQWDEFVGVNTDGTRYLVADINDGNDSTKIIYLSPQFFGFDFGVSYAPNRREGEGFLSSNSNPNVVGVTYGLPSGTIPQTTQILQRDSFDSLRNEVSYGVRYRGSFNNVGIAASFVGAFADPARNNGLGFAPAGAPAGLVGIYGVQTYTQYQANLNVTAFGFTAGVGYSWGQFGGVTGIALRQGLAASSNLGVGLSYVTGPISIGGGYFKATRDNGSFLAAGGGRAAALDPANREQTVWTIGATYTLAPGMDLFAVYTQVKDRNIANSTNNPTAWAASGADRDIQAMVVGTRLAF